MRTEKLKFPSRPARRIEIYFCKSHGDLRVVHDKTGRVMAEWGLDYKNGFPDNQLFKEAIEDCVRIAQTYDLKYRKHTQKAIAELNPVKIFKEACRETMKDLERMLDKMGLLDKIGLYAALSYSLKEEVYSGR